MHHLVLLSKYFRQREGYEKLRDPSFVLLRVLFSSIDFLQREVVFHRTHPRPLGPLSDLDPCESKYFHFYNSSKPSTYQFLRPVILSSSVWLVI